MTKGNRDVRVRSGVWSNWGDMTRMTNPLFGTEKSVVMESGFCVLKGIEGVLAHGVYGTTVIKEKRYLPK